MLFSIRADHFCCVLKKNCPNKPAAQPTSTETPPGRRMTGAGNDWTIRGVEVELFGTIVEEGLEIKSQPGFALMGTASHIPLQASSLQTSLSTLFPYFRFFPKRRQREAWENRRRTLSLHCLCRDCRQRGKRRGSGWKMTMLTLKLTEATSAWKT